MEDLNMKDVFAWMDENVPDEKGQRQPPANSRREAREERNPRYWGRPCVICFSGNRSERYTANGSCVECQRKGCGGKHTTRQSPIVDARRTAKESGAKTYEGQPCINCGSTTRLVTTTKCQQCHIASLKPLDRTPTPRQLAQASGLKRYNGSPCGKCGTTERFTSNGGCVMCIKGPGVESPRGQALEQGLKFYESTPCKRCASTQRYTSNGGCVKCVDAASERHRQARASVYHHDAMAFMWVNEPPAPGVAYLYDKLPCLQGRKDWSLRYTDAKGVGVGGRLKTGKDVLEYPEDMAWINNIALTTPGLTGGHFDILPHIRHVIREAMQAYMLIRNASNANKAANFKREIKS